MVSYKLLSKFQIAEQKDLYASLRVVFADENGSVPTVYCTDFFAEQIAAEASGLSNSKFYTETFADDLAGYKWLCPNLAQTNVTREARNNLYVQVW